MYFTDVNNKIVFLDENNYYCKYDFYYAYYKLKYNIVIPKHNIVNEASIIDYLNNSELISL